MTNLILSGEPVMILCQRWKSLEFMVIAFSARIIFLKKWCFLVLCPFWVFLALAGVCAGTPARSAASWSFQMAFLLPQWVRKVMSQEIYPGCIFSVLHTVQWQTVHILKRSTGCEMIQATGLDCDIYYSDCYECLSLCLRMGKMRTFGWPCDLTSDFGLFVCTERQM